MPKRRRGGYVFLGWKGDHGHHVHVYCDGKLIVKWDLENWKPMRGSATNRIVRPTKDLTDEGLI